MTSRFTKDLVIVTGGNVLYLLAQIAVGLLLPLAMSVDDFGYYKVYTLYLTYCGLLHFGFVDGMLLRFGGREYESLDKKKFKTYLRVFMLLELISCAAIIIISLIFLHGNMRLIIMGVSVSMILNNMILFYQYLSQATSRFKEFAILKGTNALLILLSVLVFMSHKHFTGQDTDFMTLIAVLIMISMVILCCYLWIYRDITFGKSLPLSEVTTDFIDMIKAGIIMTLAYEASRLVLLIDRQFVSVLFDIDVYAKYAFAYNILSCFTALIIGVSTVLFPKFKKLPQEEVIGSFADSMRNMTLLVTASLVAYFPICLIVRVLLPAYIDSIVYFQIIFPALALSASITIMVFTFYKVLDKNLVFMKECLITLVIALVFNILAYVIFRTPEAISVASVFVSVIWYVLSIRYLVKEHGAEWKRNFIFALSVMLCFYLSTYLIDSVILQAVAYVLGAVILTWLFWGKSFIQKKN